MVDTVASFHVKLANMTDSLISRAVWLSGWVGFLELWDLLQGRVHSEENWKCSHVDTKATIVKSGVGVRDRKLGGIADDRYRRFENQRRRHTLPDPVKELRDKNKISHSDRVPEGVFSSGLLEHLLKSYLSRKQSNVSPKNGMNQKPCAL